MYGSYSVAPVRESYELGKSFFDCKLLIMAAPSDIT
jgi:hypothetical protein